MSALNKMMGFLGLVDTDEETTVTEVPSRAAVARPTRERTGVILEEFFALTTMSIKLNCK